MGRDHWAGVSQPGLGDIPEGHGMDQAVEAALEAVRLGPLMRASMGDPRVVIGIIDGPVEFHHPAFQGATIRTVAPARALACRNARSTACQHGTAVTGILAARRGAPAPGICPGCTALLYPVFAEEPSGAHGAPMASSAEVARAITETVDAGARIINLSLGVVTSEMKADARLFEAVEYAFRRGSMVVVAAGNQGRIGFQQIIDHPWAIPVAACDVNGRVSPESNLSPSIGTRGFCAPGVDVPTTSPSSRYATISGTSVAAAFVTGALGLLWSEFPGMTAGELRRAALGAVRGARRSIVPPMFDAEAVRQTCRRSIPHKEFFMEHQIRQGETGTAAEGQPAAVVPGERERASPRGSQRSAGGKPYQGAGAGQPGGGVSAAASCPACAATAGEGGGAPPTYIHAIGSIEARFPNASIEKEYDQCVAGRETAGSAPEQVRYDMLKAYHHLATEMCWVFSVEKVETYILVPRDHWVLDELVEAVKPRGEQLLDIDVIIGTKGPVAPAEFCNGLQVPMVVVDRVYSFDKPELMKHIQKPATLTMTDGEFGRAASGLFDRIQQLADNVGATDEHRALNYLAVRYEQIYAHAAEMLGRGLDLSSVDVTQSRLSGSEKLVDVILSYRNRNTDVVEKYYVRVNVSGKYLFLNKRLAPFFDR